MNEQERREKRRQAEAILRRSGMDPSCWGFLVNDIAEALSGKKFFNSGYVQKDWFGTVIAFKKRLS